MRLAKAKRRKLKILEQLPVDPYESAKAAGLRYVSDEKPGIRRRKAGAGFTYVASDGTTIRDRDTLERIRSLVIPPAWADVWICPDPRGHIQAVGRDVKGRKQYRYHHLYRAVRDQTKFGRMIAFTAALPAIRARVKEDLSAPGLPRHKVLATVVHLLETTFIRVGNEEYKKENESYGLTTLEDRHVNVDGPRMKFKFKGKSGQTHEIELEDRRVARIVKRCQDLPGYELFQYLDQNGETCGIDSGDVNDYLREITGEDFTAKDFRTWAGTILAAEALVESGACEDSAEIKKRIVAAVKDVASRLGNRPATCRKYYVHPAIFDAYTNGILTEAMRNGKVEPAAQSAAGLRKEELCVLGVIRQAVLEEPVALPKAG